MSENTESQKSELLRELSEEEQEASSAGQSTNILSESNFIIQQTNIQTDAYSNLNFATGDSSSQKTGYNLSQTTIGFSITSGMPKTDQTKNILTDVINNIIKGLLS
ncbi:hypothetical protein IQ276_003630 [Desmonostoc muscorum LEGE 12446]|uniref:Uncharacterized protein n=1 Tax=Desmonostoc muscorum LEGE 12446 TaxID=1828758 RepID=A0A8J6ZXB7_DESMC|nr:hypothetical protein [Desmonostoc muscorum]MCF2145558.1 hypothetical protein [Desmonostoc muscorum LEGE 12446]